MRFDFVSELSSLASGFSQVVRVPDWHGASLAIFVRSGNRGTGDGPVVGEAVCAGRVPLSGVVATHCVRATANRTGVWDRRDDGMDGFLERVLNFGYYSRKMLTSTGGQEGGGLMSISSEMKDNASIRRHDLRGAIEGLKTVVMLLKSGYHFDDARAPEFIAEVERAVLILEREIVSPGLG